MGNWRAGPYNYSHLGFRMFATISRIGAALLVLVGLHSAALAHVGFHPAGLGDGLAHPISGLDHILAMVAVGLWASQLGRPAWWLLPLTFPVVMAFGALLGFAGVTLPWTEIGIGVSVLVLGLMIAFALRPSIVVSIVLIALFALIHGYAHGAELPASASPLAYGIGFVVATLVLHAIGLAFGWFASSTAGRLAMRATGTVIAVAGVVLLVI
jgi:urease accessory protein